jgi:hypothetical protein
MGGLVQGRERAREKAREHTTQEDPHIPEHRSSKALSVKASAKDTRRNKSYSEKWGNF